MPAARRAPTPGGRLHRLRAGQEVPFGGDRVAVVDEALAAAFAEGDRLVVVHETGDLLHVPAAEAAVAAAAVDAAESAFAGLAHCSDAQITDFFRLAAARLDDPSVFATVLAANTADVESARSRHRPVGRLTLGEAMRADMAAGLRMWQHVEARRDRQLDRVEHRGWSVSVRRAPLGVVGFVFEGRPNVLVDACGVLRTGNTAVLRIGSDALGTARSVIDAVIAPALQQAGLPGGAVVVVDSVAHAAGWALFSDRRLSLAVARGSGHAVAQLGAVARQHGVPASLHGTGGAWMVAAADADPQRFESAVTHSLDRKVCNTLNVCCIVDGSPAGADLLAAFERGVEAAGRRRQVTPVVHRLAPGDDGLDREYEWDEVPELAVVLVESVEQAVELFNRCSPRFVASLISTDPAAHDRFYASIDAPFVGDGFTRWVDGQFALDQPELGLSNWQSGRLFGRGGVLSGDSVYTVRLQAAVADPDLHR